jgi:1-phosphofructokinase
LLAAGREMAQRVERVLVSCSEQGAYLFAGPQAWHGSCAVPQGQLVTTVGCGDALLSGFLAGCYKGLDMPEALELAVKAAAATAMSVTAVFDPARLRTLAGKATVRRL